jgi:hypothetical protein
VSEHDEQAALFELAGMYRERHPELAMLFAIPNGAKLPYVGKGKRRYSPEAVRLKREGLQPGVPDMCLAVARGGYHGLFIELKFGSNKPRENQVQWLDRLQEQGYCAVACWGAGEAWETICEYLGIEGSEK